MDGKSSRLIIIIGCILSLQVTACSDSGSVGAGVGNTSAKPTIDTTRVASLQADTLNSYSGNLQFFSIGRFQDPLFGDLSAMGLIKPVLPPVNPDVFFDSDTKMQLHLVFNNDVVYGDSSASARFNIVEIDELWRASAWRLKDDIKLVSGATVGSFTVADEDSIDVSLSSDWVQKYAQYYNRTDSTRNSDYNLNFYGLAVVPVNSGKIITVDPSATNFLASELNVAGDTTRSTSTDISLKGYAYSLDRTNVPENDVETTNIYNTQENVLRFQFDFSSTEADPLNIARAELVVSRDKLLLDESITQAGPDASRPISGPLRLHLVQGDELPQSLNTVVTPGTNFPVAGNYDQDDEAYHFNLTGLIKSGLFNNLDPAFYFYITLVPPNGIIRSNILFNSEAGSKSPKLIITSINNR